MDLPAQRQRELGDGLPGAGTHSRRALDRAVARWAALAAAGVAAAVTGVMTTSWVAPTTSGEGAVRRSGSTGARG